MELLNAIYTHMITNILNIVIMKSPTIMNLVGILLHHVNLAIPEVKKFSIRLRQMHPTHYESRQLSIAAAYDNPACQLIVERGNPHSDVLQIAETKPLLSPCTTVYTNANSSGLPDTDITEGFHFIDKQIKVDYINIY